VLSPSSFAAVDPNAGKHGMPGLHLIQSNLSEVGLTTDDGRLAGPFLHFGQA